MKEFFATDVFHSGSQQQLLCRWLDPRSKPEYDPTAQIDEEWRRILLARYNEMESFCQVFELPVAEHSRKEIIELLEEGLPPLNHLHPLMEEFRERTQVELQSKLCLHIQSDRTRFYQEPFKGWSKTLAKRKNQTHFDIEEGSKCLAVNRNTACVFHMMRLMELALTDVEIKLGITHERSERSWGAILRKIRTEMDNRNRSGEQNWMAERSFFEEAYTSLVAVKDAWRNTTMHLERQYDSEQAEHIYRVVRAFMEKLYVTLS